NLQELNIDRSNLTSIPTEALSQLQSLTRLRMLRLTITTLPNNAFRRLHRLRSLLIANWPALDTMASNSLIGLNLTSLVISSCNLSAFPYSAIRHLVYLRYLDLSYNPITVIKGNLLGDLLRLQELHLEGGSLLRIEPGAFRGLAYFRMLNVTSNQLTTLEESVFHSVGNLQVLRLDGNPLQCDCRLLWVVRRRLRLNFDGHQPTCSSPDVVRQREFRDFSEKELPRLFTCRPARIMDRRPQEARVEEGTTVHFSCKADGDPFPYITWISSHKNVVSPTGRIRVLPNGTLEVRFAQVQDSGTYQCLAGNAAGNDSLTVGLYVKGLPRNQTIPLFSEEGWVEPSNPQAANSSAQTAKPYPFDAKTLIIATTMGFLSFLSSVAICFVFMFFWSQSKGQIKHTATIDFVPRSSMGGGGGDGAEGDSPPPLPSASEVEPDTPTSPNWSAGEADGQDRTRTSSRSGRDHPGGKKKKERDFFVGCTRQSLEENKDEVSPPAVSFRLGGRRKVTSAEICSARFTVETIGKDVRCVTYLNTHNGGPLLKRMLYSHGRQEQKINLETSRFHFNKPENYISMYHQEGSDTLYVGGQAMLYVLTFTDRGVRDVQ
ncbi:putative leucine-rich repeat and immunoglobulin-like domain-containing nogo receptor-interacting protein 1-like, partial [Scophthalmus maximus]